MYHDLLHEKDRHLVIDEARQFIHEAFARDAAPPPLLDADRYGFTRNEYDRLSEPLPWRSCKGLGFPLAAAGHEDPGPAEPRRAPRLADRLRLRQDARLRLREPAAGRAVAGQVDRSLLSRQHRLARHPPAAGEPGEAACRRRSACVRADGQPMRLVDIAAGPGRYILETLRELAGNDLSALLRDNVEANLEAGRKLAARDRPGQRDLSIGRCLRRGLAGRHPAGAQRGGGLRAV